VTISFSPGRIEKREGIDWMLPILEDFPHSFETERLLIRLPLPGDGEVVHEAIMKSIDQLKPWMPWVNPEPTKEQTEANIRKAHAAFLERTDLRFHLFEKTTKTFIGSSGLHRMDWNARRFEAGYWCHSNFTAKGYMTESVRGITVFAFQILQANRIEIKCDERNIRSRHVAERLGFQLEGILRNYQLAIDDELENLCIYAMTNTDFAELRNKENLSIGKPFKS
jgi:RimJ/RimL family protein N-acetyltransferase